MKTDREQYIAEDWDLIERYQKTRSNDDLIKIVGRFQRTLLKEARRYCLSFKSDPYDAIQYVWTWLIEHADSIDKRKTVLHWLTNAVQRGARKTAPQRIKGRPIVSFSNLGDNRSNPDDFAKKIVDPASMQADENESKNIARIREKTEAVREALNELTPKQREAATAILMRGDTRKKYADDAGGAVNTIDKQITTAKARLAMNPQLRNLAGLKPVTPTPKRERRPDRLTARQAEAVRLIHKEGLSKYETAQRLGLYTPVVLYNWKSALKKIAASPELQALTGIKP